MFLLEWFYVKSQRKISIEMCKKKVFFNFSHQTFYFFLRIKLEWKNYYDISFVVISQHGFRHYKLLKYQKLIKNHFFMKKLMTLKFLST